MDRMRTKATLIGALMICAVAALSCLPRTYVPQGSTFFENRIVPRETDRVYEAALNTFQEMGAPREFANKKGKMITTGYVYSEDLTDREKYYFSVQPHSEEAVVRCSIQSWHDADPSIANVRYEPELPAWLDYDDFYYRLYLLLEPAFAGIYVENVSLSGPPVKVLKVFTNTPAENKGIKKDDIVLEVDSQPISFSFEFWEKMLGKKDGDIVKLKIKRGKKGKETFEVEIPVSMPRKK